VNEKWQCEQSCRAKFGLSGGQWSARIEMLKKQNLRKTNTQEKGSYKDWNGFWKETVNELWARRRNERYFMGGATSHVTEDCGKFTNYHKTNKCPNCVSFIFK